MKILAIASMFLGHSLMIEEYEKEDRDIMEIIGGIGFIALGMFMATV